MYSIDGRFVFSKILSNKENQIYINGVNNGVYILKVESGKESYSQKIIIAN